MSLPNQSQAAPTSYSKHRYHALDGMRGIAAIMVMIYHYYYDLGFHFLKNCFMAVDFFFILSGFVVLHSYGEKLRGEMQWRDYLARRIARLFPLMAVGILLGIPVLYMKGGYLPGQVGAAVVTNLLFLPDLGHHLNQTSGLIFPTDDPLWSIFFEMAASIAFLGFVKMRRDLLAVLAIASFVMIFGRAFLLQRVLHHNGIGFGAGFDTATFWFGFPRVIYGFVAGMLIYKISRITPPPEPDGIVRPLLLYAALVAMLACPLRLGGMYFAAALAVFGPLLVLYGSRVVISGGLARTSEWLGYLSYPIYCLHRPVLGIVQWGGTYFHIRTHLEFGAIIVTFLLAVGVSRLVDRLGVGEQIARLIYPSRAQSKLPQARPSD